MLAKLLRQIKDKSQRIYTLTVLTLVIATLLILTISAFTYHRAKRDLLFHLENESIRINNYFLNHPEICKDIHKK